MIRLHALFAAGLGVVAAFTSTLALAVPFTPVIDEFWIVKGAAGAPPAEIFRDSFNDGAPPPSGPDDGLYNPLTYTVYGPGGITSEAGGKLTMTPSLGAPTVITTTYADVSTEVTRLLATNPANPNFLDQGSYFEIHGLFDMANLPTITGQSFGVRATDRAVGLNPPNEGDNTYYLFVGVSAITGDVSVFLRLNDFANNTSVVLWSDSIESVLSGADQIDLMLYKAAGSDQINATYSVLDYDLGNPLVRTRTFADAGAIYLGEDYIRGQFGSTDRVTIPEPATLALLGVALAGLGFSRRGKLR